MIEIFQCREIGTQEPGREVVQFQKDCRELKVRRQVTLRRQQEVLLLEHGVNLVKLSRADPRTSIEDFFRPKVSLDHAGVERLMNARVKQEPPTDGEVIDLAVQSSPLTSQLGQGRASKITVSAKRDARRQVAVRPGRRSTAIPS